MENLISLAKMAVCLIGGVAVGSWFLSRARQGHARGEAWYKPYLSPPGLIILAALILLPLILWLIK